MTASGRRTGKPASLRAALVYEPRELKFGTSGRRGEVRFLTQLEIFINAAAELEYLQSLAPTAGGITRGDDFYFAYDLRPSSAAYVPEQEGRGEIAQAIVHAIRQAGMNPVNLGQIPTPALTYYAILRGKGSIMVTGSHIPFDRNGYKTNTARGELLKTDEQPIDERVREVRARIYSEAFDRSAFAETGLFRSGHIELPREDGAARQAYIDRYAGFFGRESLRGLHVLVYQHSAVGRDLLIEILRLLGASVVAAGRSETFIPIDTENIDEAQLAAIQDLTDRASAQHGPFDAVVSTDGDSDRPLVLGVDRSSGVVRFFGGDVVGMVVAEFLGADAVVVPISCNDAIDRGALKDVLEPKTRIGSPFVIAGMDKALARGRTRVCGWEANGGFLTGSAIVRDGRVLSALPTRDAVLPILCVLLSAKQHGLALSELFRRLPARFSRAALLKNFPRESGLQIVRSFAPSRPVTDIVFTGTHPVLQHEDQTIAATAADLAEVEDIRRRLEELFRAERGFGPVGRVNYTDGLRITFRNGDVAHVRPSGNADELRIYAVADAEERAITIGRMAVAEPGGLLRQMEQAAMQGHPSGAEAKSQA